MLPLLPLPRDLLPHLRGCCPYIHKENSDSEKRQMFKQYMKVRKQEGYRTPKGDR